MVGWMKNPPPDECYEEAKTIEEIVARVNASVQDKYDGQYADTGDYELLQIITEILQSRNVENG